MCCWGGFSFLWGITQAGAARVWTWAPPSLLLRSLAQQLILLIININNDHLPQNCLLDGQEVSQNSGCGPHPILPWLPAGCSPLSLQCCSILAPSVLPSQLLGAPAPLQHPWVLCWAPRSCCRARGAVQDQQDPIFLPPPGQQEQRESWEGLSERPELGAKIVPSERKKK